MGQLGAERTEPADEDLAVSRLHLPQCIAHLLLLIRLRVIAKAAECGCSANSSTIQCQLHHKPRKHSVMEIAFANFRFPVCVAAPHGRGNPRAFSSSSAPAFSPGRRANALDDKQFRRLTYRCARDSFVTDPKCIIVSSGAVAAGMRVIGLKERPLRLNDPPGMRRRRSIEVDAPLCLDVRETSAQRCATLAHA